MLDTKLLGVDDLASMALFAQVVQAGSFTGAARAAGLTKSAVSRRIASLEERLGVRLLRRTTRQVAVTDEGLRFYAHCARLVDDARAAAAAVAGASDRIAGPIRISAPIAFAEQHLTPALAAFLVANPAVEIDLVLDDTFVDVVSGGFDLVIRIGRLAQPSLVARKLATDRLVVAGSPAYLARAGTPETPADLVHHNCLHYSLVPARGEWRFRGAAGPVDVPVRGNLTANSGVALREAALAGLGLVVTPSFMVAPLVAAGRLRLVLEGHRRAEIAIHAVVASARHLPRRLRALIDFLARHLAAHLPAP